MANGQSVGAAALNSYRDALFWLLGESHNAHALEGVEETLTQNTTSARYGHYRWLYVEKHDLVLRVSVYKSSMSPSEYWHLRLQFLNDSGVWTTIQSWQGTDAVATAFEYTIDISGQAGMTAQWLYCFRLGIWCDDTDYWVYCDLNSLRERDNVVDWTTLTAVAENGLSDEDHFNNLRHDIYQLRDYRVPLVNPLAAWLVDLTIDYGSWRTVAIGWFRYRTGDSMAGVVKAKAENNTWRWRLSVNGTVLYTSSEYGGEAWGNTSQSLASLGLTQGNYYQALIEVEKVSSGGSVHAGHPVLARVPAQAAASGWATMQEWQAWDNDLGPTNFNVYRTNILSLYSGNEILWGEHWSSGQVDDCVRAGVHRYRWLYYRVTTGATVTLHHGDDFDEEIDLPSDDDGWTAVDMVAMGVAEGSYFYLTGSDGAMESREILPV